MVLVLYTGNTLQHKLKPQAVLRERLDHVADSCLVNTLRENGSVVGNDGDHLTSVLNSDTPIFVPPLDPPPADCKVHLTAKLFLPRQVTPEEAARRTKEALMVARHRIQADCTITNLILSIDELKFSEETELLSSEELAGLWTAVTGAAKDQPTKVLNYGIAEFSSEKLAALYKYAQESGDPVPSIDHINANDCCALPPGLISFSKEHGVKLLAHHDPEQILSPQDVASLSAKFQKIDLKSWSWVLRLTYIACDRQVLTANEYLACVTV